MLPLSLYIHIPWCIRKCPYCDFNSHLITPGSFDPENYVKTLLLDLRTSLPLIQKRPINTIFIGGGTPSLLSGQALKILLEGIQCQLPIRYSPHTEITLEANPGTLERHHFAAFQEAGITRLSLGIQSFSDKHLQCLGRIHNGHEARHALETALNHFQSVNVDLMYALPAQTPQQALSDLDIAVAMGAHHVSTYQLTLEPNTPFAVQPPDNLPDHDCSADMQCALEERLAQAHFEHYEISAFAKPHHACQHNINYWEFGDYVGIGAGAHSKITLPDGILRTMRYQQPKAYHRGVQHHQPVQSQHYVDNISFEFMMNALRLTAGFSIALWEERTGLSLDQLQKPLQTAQRLGLLKMNRHAIKPTLRGQRFLNNLLHLFL